MPFYTGQKYPTDSEARWAIFFDLLKVPFTLGQTAPQPGVKIHQPPLRLVQFVSHKGVCSFLPNPAQYAQLLCPTCPNVIHLRGRRWISYVLGALLLSFIIIVALFVARQWPLAASALTPEPLAVSQRFATSILTPVQVHGEQRAVVTVSHNPINLSAVIIAVPNGRCSHYHVILGISDENGQIGPNLSG